MKILRSSLRQIRTKKGVYRKRVEKSAKNLRSGGVKDPLKKFKAGNGAGG